MIDLAPEDDHIVVRHGTTEYYNSALFHISLTFNEAVPLFICDILQSKDIAAIYGPALRPDFVLVNNHPIKTVRVFGRVVSAWVLFTSSTGIADNAGTVMLALDDCSGEKSKVTVKVHGSLVRNAGLYIESAQGALVELEGRIQLYRNQREIAADSLRWLRRDYRRDVLDTEVEKWKERLQYRNEVLKRPWVVRHTGTAKTGPIVTRLGYRDQQRKDAREKLQFDPFEVPSLVRDDSLIIFQRAQEVQQGEEIILDSDTDTEIEILQVKEVPLQVVTQFQICIEWIKWIVRRDFKDFQLSHIFNDPHISHLLGMLAQSSHALSDIGTSDPLYKKPFLQQKEILFHRIRHILTAARLISVTKSQKVRSENLRALYHHLKSCCKVIRTSMLESSTTKILDVSNYLATVRNKGIVSGDIDLKFINAIVDFITTDVWNERNLWKYDLKLTQWSFVPS